MKRRIADIFFILLFIIGLSLLAYPTVSNYINKKHSSRIISAYNSTVKNSSDEDIAVWFEEAEAYNAALYRTPAAFFNPSLLEGYGELLDITGTGIMGYIYIDAMDLQLPIYHGVQDVVMQVGVGHVEGTSLPIGGESTHCVLTAHNGLPSSRLFTGLEELEAGDRFTIAVLDRVMTYEVDQVKVVDPDESQDIMIEPGNDYCTLLTCTPYGINTHRLLVRGARVSNTLDELKARISNEVFRIDAVIAAPIVAAPFLILLLIEAIFLFKTRKKR